MWTINKITATNVASFKSLEFRPNKGVATLIFGQNLDNADNQPSNGSGKSALIEAIALAMTGEPLRKVKIDEIIRDDAEEMTVFCNLSNTETGQMMEIDRRYSRKNPQSISVNIDGEERVQASVNDYNRYILEVIGITKDEFYSYFVLTETKYQSFFAAPDKDKKAIINKFSNAVLVDQAIDAITVDIEPLAQRVNDTTLEVSKCTGAVEVIEQQLATAKEREEEAAVAKKERKEELQSRIAESRAKIREYNEEIRQKEAEIDKHSKGLDQLDLEEADTDKPFNDTYKSVNAVVSSLIPESSGRKLSDWPNKVQQTLDSIKGYEGGIKKAQVEAEDLNKRLEEGKILLDKASKEYGKATQENIGYNDAYRDELKKMVDKRDALQREHATLLDKITDTNKAIHSLKVALAGTITCPKCAHRFILNSDVNVEEAETKIERFTSAISVINGLVKGNEENQRSCNEDIQNLDKSKEEHDKKCLDARIAWRNYSNDVDQLKVELNRLETLCDSYKGTMETLNEEFSQLRTKMFDEAFDIIEDAMDDFKYQIKRAKNNISALEGMIETYAKQYDELDTQKESFSIVNLTKELADKNKLLKEAKDKYKQAKSEYDILESQSKRFVRFKSMLANSKITALSQMLNGILEKLGSDLRVRIDGFKVLKNGNVRDKITVAILRDAVEFGSYFKLSKGERARIDTACIVAMSKLINANCENGRGLDLLVMDEILNGVDELGLVGIYEALNQLQVTTIVVSHNPIAQSYPYTLTVTKEQGVSTISQ